MYQLKVGEISLKPGKIVVVSSGKGGAGKSMTSGNLAVAAGLCGMTPVVIDLDNQATSAKWGDRRGDLGPGVISAHPSRLDHVISAAREQGADIIIIDTPPHSEIAALEASKVADLVIVPVRPATSDIETLPQTFQLHVASGSKAPARVLLTQHDPRTSLLEESIQAVDQMGYERVPVVIGARADFQRAWTAARGILEYAPKSKSADEITDLWMWVVEQLNEAKGRA